MARIWANRLEVGDQVWSSVPEFRHEAVKAVMQEDVKNEKITKKQYKEICGEEYPEPVKE